MQVQSDPRSMPKIPDAKVAILQSKWYREYTDKMIQKTIELLRAADCPQPSVHVLPGSIELPLAAQSLLRKERHDAIICFGAIIKGETYHFDMVMNMCAEGLNRVMIEENVPIIVEVIPVSDVKYLEARSKDDAYNKGIEAAMVCAEIIDWRRRHILTRAP